jgi:hypothetical protein
MSYNCLNISGGNKISGGKYQAEIEQDLMKTAIKLFLRELVAVNPLYTIVFGVANHQTVVQSKMALAPSRLIEFQCCQ